MDQCGTSTGTPLCICVSVSTRACVCVSRQCVMPQWIHPLTHPLARCTYASYACTAIWMENENDRPRRSDIGLDLLFSRIFLFFFGPLHHQAPIVRPPLSVCEWCFSWSGALLGYRAELPDRVCTIACHLRHAVLGKHKFCGKMQSTQESRTHTGNGIA